MANFTDLPVTVNAAQGKLRLWRNTRPGRPGRRTSRALAPHTVGLRVRRGRRQRLPAAGLIRLSTTTGPTPEYLTDFGNDRRAGTTTHHLTLYRAASGALVFSAPARSSGRGVSTPTTTRPSTPKPADQRMQQAQVNLLADMGAQPATLMPGLVAATATDATAPARPSSITRRPARQSPTAPGSPSTGHGRGRRRRRGRRRSRSPPTAAPPGTRPRARRAGATPTRSTGTRPAGARRAPSTTAPTSAPGEPAHPERPAPARSSATRCPPMPAVDDSAAPPSWGSASCRCADGFR